LPRFGRVRVCAERRVFIAARVLLGLAGAAMIVLALSIVT